MSATMGLASATQIRSAVPPRLTKTGFFAASTSGASAGGKAGGELRLRPNRKLITGQVVSLLRLN